MDIRRFGKLIRRIAADANSGSFKPILEADLQGYLYHLLLSETGFTARDVHLNTRLYVSKNDNDKFDLAIGKIVNRKTDKRPSVDPEVVVEIKMFASGFTNQQKCRRFRGISEDMDRLADLKVNKKTLLIQLVYDDTGHLVNGNRGESRKQKLIQHCESLRRDVRLILVCRKDNSLTVDYPSWRFRSSY